MTWTDELYFRVANPEMVVRDGVPFAERQVGRREAIQIALRLIWAAVRPDRRTYRW